MSNTGEGEYVPSPRPNPRLRPEGAAYAERNRGTMERWFDYSDTKSSTSGGGSGGRKVFPDANTTTGIIGGGYSDVAPSVADQNQNGRGTPPEQEPYMSRSNIGGGGEGDNYYPYGGEGRVSVGAQDSSSEEMLAEQCSQLSLASKASKLPSAADEARGYAQRNRGTMDNIINNYGVASPTNPTAPQDGAVMSRSQTTETNPPPPLTPPEHGRRSLHMESAGMTWEENRPVPRIRAEGESIAQKNSHDSMFGIMSSQNSTSSEASPTRKPHSDKRSQESTDSPQAPNQPRARPGEGRKNYERAHDQSEMAAILRGEAPQAQPSNQARKAHHLQRSELW